MIKRICLIILSIMMLFSCTIKNKEYNDYSKSTELGEIASESFDMEGSMEKLDEDVILKFSDVEIPFVVDYCVYRANISNNINEFGIFKVENGKTKDLENILKKYVSNLQDTYRSMNYFPSEKEKIDFATVKTFGNYVIYSFLNEKDTESFYKSIENLISK